MADDDQTAYDNGTTAQSAQPLTRTPFRGMRVRSRSTGQIYYWVGGQYVAENDPRRLSPSDAKMRDAALAEAQGYTDMLPDMQRFQEINRRTSTGALSHQIGNMFSLNRGLNLNVPDLLHPGPNSALGNTINHGADIDELRAINNRWSPKQRVVGSGSSSDRDVWMYSGALPGLNYDGPGNDQIISDIQRNARNAQDRADFYEWVWPRTGSLHNAQSAWNEFQQQRQRQPSLTWRQYFHVDQPQQPATQQQQPSQIPPPPPGVSAEDWQYMTPEGRALWRSH